MAVLAVVGPPDQTVGGVLGEEGLEGRRSQGEDEADDDAPPGAPAIVVVRPDAAVTEAGTRFGETAIFGPRSCSVCGRPVRSLNIIFERCREVREWERSVPGNCQQPFSEWVVRALLPGQ